MSLQQFVDQRDIYGDELQRKHAECRDCCVLIDVDHKSQCGIILACADSFCYVLTVNNPAFTISTKKIVVTFGNLKETTFDAKDVSVESSRLLSILFFRRGIDQSQAKKAAEFDSQDSIQEAVIYTLSYTPKVHFMHEQQDIETPAASYFRGGNPGLVDVQGNGIEVFYHNCSAGEDVTTGSGVLNGKQQIIGMNLEYSNGWFMAMNLKSVRSEITSMAPRFRRCKTFADIKMRLEPQGRA